MADKEYIDRDEAIRKAISACIKVVSHGITQIDAVDIADEIDAIPAADVVEVRHGEWVLKDNKGNGVCSVCNRQDGIDPLATHCRYCGAKMGGGKADG